MVYRSIVLAVLALIIDRANVLVVIQSISSAIRPIYSLNSINKLYTHTRIQNVKFSRKSYPKCARMQVFQIIMIPVTNVGYKL